MNYSDRQITGMGRPDKVIEGGILITMAEGQSPISDARIFIKEDKIVDIQMSGDKYVRNDRMEVIDARDTIIMPGLINSHSHAAMTIFRGLADDLPLKEWLFNKIFPSESQHLSPETVYWGTLLGCLEMIASGTTSFIDGYFFEDMTAKAVHKSGLRALLAQGILDFSAPGV
ncbi:MAG: amidohydrolase family protein, partial [Thermodesulfobacteriota bacterium]|nr:amidohydrolase family protein [Thermodesulfobacteriota bacterium]